MMQTQNMKAVNGDTNEVIADILYERVNNEGYSQYRGNPDTLGWHCFITLNDTAYIISSYEEGVYEYQTFADPMDAGFRWLDIENMYEKFNNETF